MYMSECEPTGNFSSGKAGDSVTASSPSLLSCSKAEVGKLKVKQGLAFISKDFLAHSYACSFTDCPWQWRSSTVRELVQALQESEAFTRTSLPTPALRGFTENKS